MYNDLLTNNNQSLNNIVYRCDPCQESYYTKIMKLQQIGHVFTVDTIEHYSKIVDLCIQCPYGAECSGNNVVPRPNYWGY